MYYTYVLLSEKNGKLYVGCTENLKQRMSFHRSGYVTSTKPRRPLKLVYYEACLSQKLARQREQQLKTGFGRAYLKRRIMGL